MPYVLLTYASLFLAALIIFSHFSGKLSGELALRKLSEINYSKALFYIYFFLSELGIHKWYPTNLNVIETAKIMPKIFNCFHPYESN